MNSKQIPIAQIKTEQARRRPLSNITVSEISKSISEFGLLHPITVTEDYTLIAGLHRLRACQQLGWKKIPATVTELAGLKAELAEIDENIVRNCLTPLDEADQMARRKEIYEILHPGANAGAHRAAGMNRKLGNDVDEVISPTFVQDTAAKTKASERTVQQNVQISANIAPAVKETIRQTGIPFNKTNLLKLSRVKPDKQAEEVERLIYKRDASASQSAHTTSAPETEALSCPPQFNTIVADLSLLNYDLAAAKLTIKNASKPDSILWLWANTAQVKQAFEIITGAGFAPRTMVTWIKGDLNSHGVYEKTEHCILALRGNLEVEVTDQGLALITAGNDDGRKPEEFYKLVERLCPPLRIELCVSDQREGWGIDPDPADTVDSALEDQKEQDPDQLQTEGKDYDPDQENLMMEAIAAKLGKELPTDGAERLKFMRETYRDIQRLPSDARKVSPDEKQFLKRLSKDAVA